MPTPSIVLLIIIIMLFIITLASLGVTYYFWRKSRNYTRERFAFFTATFIISSSSLLLLSFLANRSPWVFTVEIASYIINLEYSPPAATWQDQVIAIIFMFAVYYALFKIYADWEGKKSEIQNEREKNNVHEQFIFIFVDSREWLTDFFRRDKRTLPYTETATTESRFESPKLLSWHERARSLWTLKFEEYQFEDEDWHSTEKCWLSKHSRIPQRIVLACYHSLPDDDTLLNLLNYVQKVELTSKEQLRVVIALSDVEQSIEPRDFYKHKIEFFTESQLLDNLADFSSYFKHLKKQVTQKFPGLDLTLTDMYTVSDYKLQAGKGERKHDVEQWINTWLGEHSKRHLSILGEFGYGKTTLSQMLAYRLSQDCHQNSSTRIPIIIELRGTSPRNLSPFGFLATWSKDFGVNSQAMLQLLIAGRLLIIFEGFDEVDLAGDREMRLRHFESLWQFAHDNAKLLFTGRPNFFFDEKELELALLIQQPSETTPYCQAIYLESFNLPQIQSALYQLKTLQPTIQQEILALAEANPKFLDVVARPSILRMVASIWKEAKLSEYKERINSAYVMELFINKTSERQVAKEQKTADREGREFSRLNSQERIYFMQGIAAYMVVHELPNQISAEDLNKITRQLLDNLPEQAVSKLLSSIESRRCKLLRERIDFKNNPRFAIESIQTDVRSCGLLVSDLTKSNTFKFAHKSFMEFLAAKVYADWLTRQCLSPEARHIAKSLKQQLKMKRGHMRKQKEVKDFFGEVSVANLQKSGENDLRQLAQQLLVLLTGLPYWVNILLLEIVSKSVGIFHAPSPLLSFLLKYRANRANSENSNSLLNLIAVVGLVAIVGSEAIAREVGVGTFLVLGVIIGAGIDVVEIVLSYCSLWYEICRTAGINREIMVEVVGKSSVKFLEDRQAE